MITKLEVKRQSVHIICGLILATLIWFDYGRVIPFLALIAICLSWGSNYVRIPVFSYFLDHFERKYEKKNIRAKGLVFYLLGIGMAVAFFDKEIALACTMILAFGDSISRLVGPFGYVKHPFNNDRFMEGIIVGGVVATLAASLFIKFEAALMASVIAMYIESWELHVFGYKIDDNVLIPLFSGLILVMLV